MLDKLWDDVVAGPSPSRGLGKLRSLNTQNLEGEKLQRSLSSASEGSTSATPVTPSTPTTPSTPSAARKVDVWRSVFNPGSNLNTRTVGAKYFDKPTHSSSPTVYDWLYSGDTRSKRS